MAWTLLCGSSQLQSSPSHFSFDKCKMWGITICKARRQNENIETLCICQANSWPEIKSSQRVFTVLTSSFKLYARFCPQTICSSFCVSGYFGFVCSDRFLLFIYRPVGMPKMEKVYLHNPSSEQISLISISATTAHFHASFFQNRVSTNSFN